LASNNKDKPTRKTSKNRAKAKAESETLESTQQEVEPEASTGFPIVGIGASAGGLAAFEAFFSGMPVDTDPGMAFVLVQHLDPDHKSLLTELVRRYTRMQVFEVEDGMTVEPNCAYIIPPGRDMAFLKGTLQLLEPSSYRGHRLPIDFFFRSLAQDQHERAICIVLSGTGSDGTLGVRAIKGEGGMVMAQNPDSTEYDGMPRNAIATGMVDYVLPPAVMPAQLMSYTNHSFVNGSRQAAVAEEETDKLLKNIFTILRSQIGHDFSQFKQSTIQRRIERRMAVHQIDTLAEYEKYIQQNPVETEALFHDLLIGVTRFFRDPEAFRAIEQKVIPKLLAGRPANTPLRIWAPGCSTGEEAYSLAILIAEHQEQERRRQEAERERIRQEEARKAEQQEAAQAADEQSAGTRLAVGAETDAKAAVEQTAAATHGDDEPGEPAAATEPADDGALMTLGDIQDAIAPLSISAAGLSELGIEPVGREKAAKLYRAADFSQICEVLAQHLLTAATGGRHVREPGEGQAA